MELPDHEYEDHPWDGDPDDADTGVPDDQDAAAMFQEWLNGKMAAGVIFCQLLWIWRNLIQREGQAPATGKTDEGHFTVQVLYRARANNPGVSNAFFPGLTADEVNRGAR